MWGRAASLSRAADLGGAGFGDLLGLDDVDRLVTRQALRTPFLRVARDGSTLADRDFTRGGGVGAAIADQVADDRLARLFAGGSTIVLQGLHRSHAPLVDFSQALAADLGHPVQVNAYVTPPQSQGFSPHYDVHDVFVLQAAGEKRWVIHEPVLPWPLRDQPWDARRDEVAAAARRDPLLDVVLRPGDALYLPRGFIHSATALGGVSAHVTVGVHQWTRRHLLDRLLEGLGDEADLRAPLPLGVDVGDPAALAGDLAAVARVLGARAEAWARPGAAAEVVAATMRGAAGTATRAEPVGPMRQAATLAVLTGTTRLRLRRGLRPRVTAGADGAPALATSELVAAVPGADPEALARLAAGEVVTAARLSADGTTGTARALVSEALAVAAEDTSGA